LHFRAPRLTLAVQAGTESAETLPRWRRNPVVATKDAHSAQIVGLKILPPKGKKIGK
jgi:hypothetical protein